MAREYHLNPVPPAAPPLDYAAELNEEQCAAATAPPGPLLVLAGAGSGKTRTLTYRVAYLVENGIAPERILLLTFTNKAAREMLQRVEDLVPLDLKGMWGGTFHSIGNRLLRRWAPRVGLKSDFTILDRDDALATLKLAFDKLGIDRKNKQLPSPASAHELFSFSANTRQPIEDLFKGPFDGLGEHAELLRKWRAEYREQKLALNAADYDDLLTLPLDLFEQDPDVLARCQEHWLYILVDEYQDTNAVQGAFIDCLVAQHRNVMVVGDDAQSIYAWRGADFKNILSFPERYPDAKVFKILTNYRSTQPILDLANASIAHNILQFPKELHAVRESDSKPLVVPCEDPREQAQFVGQRILELNESGTEFREMAVLYRAHSHALELQLEFTRRGLPFTITSGIQFFEQAHVKDVVAILRAATQPDDELSFKRVVRLVPGVGERAADKLWAQLRTQRDWSVASVPSKATESWEQLAAVIDQLRATPTPALPDMIQWAVEGFYEAYVKVRFDNAPQRLDDLKELREFARPFETMSDFLAQIALLTNVDGRGAKGRDQDAVRLSTIHQAKGLEWSAVFVIMLCDGMFPLSRAMDSREQLEEERRLFYVAATRAKDELAFCYPRRRPGRGLEAFALEGSCFLRELPQELYEVILLRPASGFGRGAPRNQMPSNFDWSDTDAW